MNRLLLLLIPLLAISCASTDYEIQPDPIYRETEIRQSRPRLAGEVFDEKESDPAYREIFAAADKTAERAVGNVPRNSDFVFTFWDEKKRILKTEYGIDWKTPAELNPHISYGRYGAPDITSTESDAAQALVRVHLVGESEEIVGEYRNFKGQLFVVTQEAESGIVRHYELEGHDEIWEFINVYEWSE